MKNHIQKSGDYAMSAIESIKKGKYKDAQVLLDRAEEQRVKHWENKEHD